jgi:hypothetical protein
LVKIGQKQEINVSNEKLPTFMTVLVTEVTVVIGPA